MSTVEILGKIMDDAPAIKLCVNCVHHRHVKPRFSSSFRSCMARIHQIKVNPVTGEETRHGTFCWAMRRDSGLCGPDGALFEKKP